MPHPIANEPLTIIITPKNLPADKPITNATSAKIIYMRHSNVTGTVDATIDTLNNTITGTIPIADVVPGIFIYHGVLVYPGDVEHTLEGKKTTIDKRFSIA